MICTEVREKSDKVTDGRAGSQRKAHLSLRIKARLQVELLPGRIRGIWTMKTNQLMVYCGLFMPDAVFLNVVLRVSVQPAHIHNVVSKSIHNPGDKRGVIVHSEEVLSGQTARLC
jgi:hypothetical protein